MSAPLRLQVTTPPTVWPVSLNQAKAQLNLDDDFVADDALLSGQIEAATELAERVTTRALITQTLTLWLDDWPRRFNSEPWWDGVRDGALSELLGDVRYVELPRPPLQSVTSISTFDDSDSETTYASSKYFVDTATEPGRVVLRTAAAAPYGTRVANAVKVVYTAGYGDAPGDVPHAIRQGILRTVGELYIHRGDCDPEEAAQNAGAMALWNQYKVRRL